VIDTKLEKLLYKIEGFNDPTYKFIEIAIDPLGKLAYITQCNVQQNKDSGPSNVYWLDLAQGANCVPNLVNISMVTDPAFTSLAFNRSGSKVWVVDSLHANIVEIDAIKHELTGRKISGFPGIPAVIAIDPLPDPKKFQTLENALHQFSPIKIQQGF
jgi:DNA-binding beta-propeller fold protein YncE